MAQAETDGAKYTFLLVGKTGSGKSTTGNTILRKKAFRVVLSADSVTSDCEVGETEQDGVKIKVVDSPGLFDTTRSHQEVGVTIMKTVVGMHPGPDAILYIVSLAGRYTEEDFAAYKRLKAVFHDEVCDHVIVVFTHGDQLEENDQSARDYIATIKNPNLLQVLDDCNGRYVVFNNKAQHLTPQVKRLLEKVRSLNAENNGRPYNCPKYAVIGETMEEELATRLAEVEKRELETKKTFQELEQKTQKAQEDKKKAEEDKKKSVEEKKKAEEDKKKAEEDKKKAEEDKKKADEGKKKAEEDKKKAEEGKKKAEEDKKKAEEGKKKAEEGKKKAEEGKKKAEEDKKKAEEDKKKAMIAELCVLGATAAATGGLAAVGGETVVKTIVGARMLYTIVSGVRQARAENAKKDSGK